MDELLPERAFLELSIRTRTNLNTLEVFHKFIDDEVIEIIINSWGLEAFSLGRRTDSSNDHRVLIGPKLVWQSTILTPRFLHNNQEGTIAVDSVEKRWIDVMKK